MIKVDQTRLFDDPRGPGNCFQACIASILHLHDIDMVPDWADSMIKMNLPTHDIGAQNRSWSQYWIDTSVWLRDSYGLQLLEVDHGAYGIIEDCLNIISGRSPRNPGMHSVVGQGDVIVHDPHPDRTGILEHDADNPWTHTYFVAIDASGQTNRTFNRLAHPGEEGPKRSEGTPPGSSVVSKGMNLSMRNLHPVTPLTGPKKSIDT